jgi:hypothetical protein
MLVAGWPDITRYFKIKSIGSHPEIVPIEGTHSYAGSGSEGTPDGTGDFDSASRGGPANGVAGRLSQASPAGMAVLFAETP